MFDACERDDVTVIVGQDELSREDLAQIGRLARAARAAGRRVVVNLEGVRHLHYAAALESARADRDTRAA